MAVDTRALAHRLPDLPRLVETRAMLLSGACEVLGDAAGGHYVVRSLDAALAAVVGRPAAALIREAAGRGRAPDVLSPEGTAPHVQAALQGWTGRRALIHVLAQPRSPDRPGTPCDIRMIANGERLPLHHLPAELR